MSGTARLRNHLAGEKSLYLRQHAQNPVDWYPWGEEAFAKARNEDKPIFLSIGYSACHWCHVMARESFEDDYVASILNRSFVSIKVDREERPDIDSIYMLACQMISGGGGWPLTIVTTPDGRPFFAGTYFSKGGGPGSPGLIDILENIGTKWRMELPEVLKAAESISQALKEFASYREPAQLSENILTLGFKQAEERFDRNEGGFEIAPKFPSPHRLIFLLRYYLWSGEAMARDMAALTLRKMQDSALFDHVGYGFHRYSTDARWLLPHFEKMLYDQALMGLAYSEAFASLREESFKRTAMRTFAYVGRDMTSPYGAFFSAESADSEGEEGKFYVWRWKEIEDLLGESAPLFIRAFDVRKEGNFRDEATRRRTGNNVLHLSQDIAKLAESEGMREAELRSTLERSLARLFEARESRQRPEKDDKVQTDWNGLMIAALARSSLLLDEKKLRTGARRAADFIVSEMSHKGRLKHRFVDGNVAVEGFLDDYTFLAWGLIELYRADGHERYLRSAIELVDNMVKHFWNETSGGFFFTADDAQSVIARRMEGYDGAMPSGNSVAACVLADLSCLIKDKEMRSRGLRTVRAFAADLNSMPIAHMHMLQAIMMINRMGGMEGSE